MFESINYDYLVPDLLDGYQKLIDAAQKVSPALVDLEEKHLNRFTLTWEVFNKHLYQSVIYTDPLIQNNLPIFISQVISYDNRTLMHQRIIGLTSTYLIPDNHQFSVTVTLS